MLLIIFALSLLSTGTFGQQGSCENAKYKFSCTNSNQKQVTIYGTVNVTCPDGYICNSNYKEVASKCPMCVDASTECPFTCVDSTKFKDDELEINCPSGYICNQKQPKDTCDPCIKEKCDDNAWTCDPNNTSLFSTPLFSGACKPNAICKTEKVAPCNEFCYFPGGNLRRSFFNGPNYIIL